MLHSLLVELVKWVYNRADDYDMAMLLAKYMMAYGELTFRASMPDPSSALEDPYVQTYLVKETDGLSTMSPKGWTRRFINKFIQITHQPWIYWYYKVHFQTKGGLTVKNHYEIFDRLEKLMYADPDGLLPQHQQLILVYPLHWVKTHWSISR